MRELVLCSEAIVSAFQKAERVARSSCNLLITGERGTGKDVLARYIHDHSGRAGKFVAFNCATAPDDLFESELFGHARGAFTGAVDERDGLLMIADRGTILLDELAELSPRAQAKLLRVLENKETKRVGENKCRKVDVRIIGATNRDIVPGGGSAFLKDLYDRFAEYVISVPPLRDRPEDLRSFVPRFLSEITAELAHPVAGISEGVLDRLIRYSWPGNIRELKRVLLAAVMDTPAGHLVLSSSIQLGFLGALTGEAEPRNSTVVPDARAVSRIPGANADSNGSIPAWRGSDDELRALYERHHGNVSRVAKDMGVVRQTAQKKLRRLKLR